MTFAARTQAGAAAAAPPFTPVTRQYPSIGSFTEVIPTPAPGQNGPSSLYVEVGGPGGGGAYSTNLPVVAGGGGSGSLCSATFPLTSADYGKTFSIVISAGGAGGDPIVDFHGGGALPSTITNGSFTRTVNMQAGGGQGGAWNPPAGGAGGVASGGQSNLNGAAGQAHQIGGAAVVGRVIRSGAGGAASTQAGVTASPGLGGAAAFSYS